jgi:hypothetical protein
MKKEKKESEKEVKREVEKGQGVIFTSRDGKNTAELVAPDKESLSSMMFFGILQSGKVPKEYTRQYAPAYHGFMFAHKGKNCLGFFNKKNMLIVNGIADLLVEDEVGGVYCPEKSKSYRAINLAGITKEDFSVLKGKIINALKVNLSSGGGKKPKSSKEPNVAEVIPELSTVIPEALVAEA